MLPPKITGVAPDQQRLLGYYRQLSATDREALLAFAEFLVRRGGLSGEGEPAVPSDNEPRVLPRPNEETVVAAIRRLTATYPMLNRDELLHEASELMTAHVMRGRAAIEVIDELEVVFRRHYERVRSRS